MTPSLAERLKSETRVLHTAAERSRLMGALLRGELARSDYVALLRNLHAIYAALEPALARHASHPIIAPVFMPALWRTPALEHDLFALHGRAWADDVAVAPSAAEYIRRIDEIAMAKPELLLSHAYVRYLGDLSGGQMLRRLVATSMPVATGHATAFYDFGDAGQTDALAKAFRAGLARIDPPEDEADAIVSEARHSFHLHQRLFDELAEVSPSLSTAGR